MENDAAHHSPCLIEKARVVDKDRKNAAAQALLPGLPHSSLTVLSYLLAGGVVVPDGLMPLPIEVPEPVVVGRGGS